MYIIHTSPSPLRFSWSNTFYSAMKGTVRLNAGGDMRSVLEIVESLGESEVALLNHGMVEAAAELRAFTEALLREHTPEHQRQRVVGLKPINIAAASLLAVLIP